jgi:hypothetical protein
MTIGGVSVIFILGIFNFFLLLFQLLSGLHKINVRPKVHKKTGIVLLVTATLHGGLAILARFL